MAQAEASDIRKQLKSDSPAVQRRGLERFARLAPRDQEAVLDGTELRVNRRTRAGTEYLLTGSAALTGALVEAFLQLSSPASVRTRRTLRHLHVDATRLRRVPYLTPLSNLRGLNLFKGKFRTLDGIDRVQTLESLRISGSPDLRSIEALAKLRRLEAVELSSCPNLRDLSPLRKSKWLRNLVIRNCPRAGIADIAGQPRLEQLRATRVRSERRDAAALGTLEALRDVDISGWSAVRDLEFARRQANLRELRACGCPELEDATALGSCRKLKIVVLSNCKRLRTVAGLERCPRLAYVWLDDCPALAEIGGLASKKSVRVELPQHLAKPRRPPAPAPIPLLSIFEDGHKVRRIDGKDCVTKPYAAGSLALSSGRVVACDPFVGGQKPIDLAIRPGRYPVVLALVIEPRRKSPRVAAAMLRLSPRTAAEHRPVRQRHMAIPVDSATAAFMDADVARVLFMRSRQAELAPINEQLERPGPQNVDVAVAGGNIISFPSGFGDGVYPVYAGRTGGAVVSIVIDFLVVPTLESAERRAGS